MKASPSLFCVLSLAALTIPVDALSQHIGWTNEEIDAWAEELTVAGIWATAIGDGECGNFLSAAGAGWSSPGLRVVWTRIRPRASYFPARM